MNITDIEEAEKLRGRASELEAKAIERAARGECKEAAMEINEREGNVAVFLGAGAPKGFGWPLTNELLPAILQGLVAQVLFEDPRFNTKDANREDRELLKKTLEALCPGLRIEGDYLTQNRHRLPLVTSLLSMLDYSLAPGQVLIRELTP